MKAILIFAIVAVMAIGVCSNDLLDAVPRDVGLPASFIPKTRRTGTGRIVGGNEINQNDRKLYKHQVGLHFDNKFWCGGSIISQNTIITAAHCTEDMSFGNVFIGLYDKSKMSASNTQIIKITKENWVQHPGYSSSPIFNDLAIINLPEPIKFGEFVGPIEVECDDRERHENEAVQISGWGRHSDSNSAQTTVLRAATVQTAPGPVCNIFRGGKILPSMICVRGTNSIGTCQGDSGGPIVSTKNGKLLGATSFGAQGCQQDLPRVFTRLSSFAKWIQDNSVDHIKNC